MIETNTSLLKSFSEHDGLLFASKVGHDGIVAMLDNKLAGPLHCKPGEIVWLHMCATNPATREFLENNTGLDDIVIANLLAEETRPRLLVRGQTMLAILRAVNLEDRAEPEDMISLRIWMDDRHIITTRLRDTRSIEDMKKLMLDGAPPDLVGRFLTAITDRVYARMEPFIEAQDDVVGQLEEMLARDELEAVSERLSDLRLQNAIYRRFIIPQKQVLENMHASVLTWLDEDDHAHLAESLDRVTRYMETLNDVRDRLAIINDETARRHDKALNSTTYIFTAAATIFLPLSFITGLLGVNVGGIPGMEYQPSFWILIGVCGLIAALQIFYFWRKGWF